MREFDYSKISVTAKLVAFYRKFSDIPFAPDIADYIHAQEAFLEIVGKLDASSDQPLPVGKLPEEGKIYAPVLEARYKSIVQLIIKSGVKQILELASGFSLRGLAMTQDPEYVYVESDLPGLNDEKMKLIGAVREKHNLQDFGNYHIVTANALELGELQKTTRYFRLDQPLLIVNEGLIMYLSAHEREIVAGNILELLKNFSSGMWITPDFTTRQLADNVSDNVKRFRMAVAGTTDRQMYESAFESEEAIHGFISDNGFAEVCRNQLDEVTHLKSVETLGISKTVMEHVRPRMRIWQLTPASARSDS